MSWRSKRSDALLAQFQSHRNKLSLVVCMVQDLDSCRLPEELFDFLYDAARRLMDIAREYDNEIRRNLGGRIDLGMNGTLTIAQVIEISSEIADLRRSNRKEGRL